MYKISHIETETEIIIKFTTWVQTFSLYPIIKEWKDIDKITIKHYKKNLKNALDNLK